MNSVILDNNCFIFKCPHCYEFIQVYKNETNCCIFRHAVYKHNMEQINPHTSKIICDKLFQENKIYGCGKPFRFIYNKNNTYHVEICDYI